MTLPVSARRWALAFACFYAAATWYFHRPLYFGYDLGGYYNYLTRGLAEGHLYVPIQPTPEILAAPNPQDPNLPMEWKMHDMVLYKGRYYLYHGIGPVLLTFGPWRVLWGVDLPEAVAGWLLTSMGLWALLILAQPLDRWRLLALGLASGLLVLLPRFLVYEVAIASGFACLAWAFVFREQGEDWLAGLCLGLALLSRPHLALALVFFRWRSWLTFSIGAAVFALYNYARFGSPWELGLRYMLSGPGQQVPVPELEKSLGALYWLLLQAPQVEWPRLLGRMDAWFPTPGSLYHEPLVGGVFLAPFIVLARRCNVYMATGLLTLAFVCYTGWATQRYVVDFLPWLVLGSLLSARHRYLPWFVIAGALLNLWYLFSSQPT
jgi:hypothetical protein